MSTGRGYGAIREYRDDPNPVSSRVYRDNPGPENFDKLATEVTNNTLQINTSATAIERLMNQVGTSADSADTRDKIHEMQQRPNKLANKTSEAIKRLFDIKGTSRQQRLKAGKLKDEFQDTVSRYSSIQKRAHNKVLNAPPLKSTTKKPLVDTSPGTIGWNDDFEDQQARLMEREQRQAQLEIEREEIDVDLAFAQEREEQIRQLEGDILDINEMFRDLAANVHSQGEMIDNIEDNVITAQSNVERGNQDLTKAASYSSKYRKKICILLVILAIVAAIIAIIIVTQVKK